jgi:hypothetical protein
MESIDVEFIITIIIIIKVVYGRLPPEVRKE